MDKSKVRLPKVHYSKGSKIHKKPKRNISAYHIFSKEMHAMLNNSGNKVNPNQRMALISEKWSSLPPEEKYIYMEKAKLDKVRYLNEMKYYYSSSASVADSTSIKNKPKKFGNAFTFFLREKKEVLRESHPKLSMSDIMSLVAKHWRAMSEAEKQKYVDASEEDKKRYKREVSEMYETSKGNGKSRKKKFLDDIQPFETWLDNPIIDTCQDIDAKVMKAKLENLVTNTSKQANASKFDNLKRLIRIKPACLPSFTVLDRKTNVDKNPKVFSDTLPNPAYEKLSVDSTLPKVEYGEIKIQKTLPLRNLDNYLMKNNSYQRGDSFDLFNLGAKSSQPCPPNLDQIPQLPSLNSFSLANGDIYNDANTNNYDALNSEEQKDKGRDYLNGILANALDSVGPMLSANDSLGDNPFSTGKSHQKDSRGGHFE